MMSLRRCSASDDADWVIRCSHAPERVGYEVEWGGKCDPTHLIKWDGCDCDERMEIGRDGWKEENNTRKHDG